MGRGGDVGEFEVVLGFIATFILIALLVHDWVKTEEQCMRKCLESGRSEEECKLYCIDMY